MAPVKKAMFCGDDDEEYYYGVGNEPSEYEQMLESKRQQRLLDRQIEQYGDDAMRTDARLASDSGSIPTEEFQRSYQMRIPGVKHAKAPDKDPLRSLLKANRSCDFTAHMCTGIIHKNYKLFVNPLFKINWFCTYLLMDLNTVENYLKI